MRRTLTWTPDQDIRRRRQQNRRSHQGEQRRGSRSDRPPSRRFNRGKTDPSKTSRPKTPQQNLNIAEQYILKQIREKTPMVVHGYEGVQYGLFVKLSKYHLTTLVDQKKRGNEKLSLSCYYKQRDEALVQQVMQIDDGIVRQRLEPIRPRKDRYALSNEVLAQCRREGTPVKIALRTGEVFQGRIQWFTPFDIGLMLPTQVKVMIFRHAIYHFETLSEGS